jgi:hypothetical protein
LADPTAELPPEAAEEPSSEASPRSHDDYDLPATHETFDVADEDSQQVDPPHVEVSAEANEPVESPFVTQPMSPALGEEGSSDVRHSDEVRFAAKFGNLYGPIGGMDEGASASAEEALSSNAMPVEPAEMRADAMDSTYPEQATEPRDVQESALDSQEEQPAPSQNAAFLLDREPEQDPDSVTSVLSRLMQAGIWHEEGAAKPSLDLPELDPAEQPSAENAPEVRHAFSDEPTAEESNEAAGDASEMPEEAVDADEMPCRTMDVSELMGERQAPRSWRAELLGDDAEASEPSESFPASDGFHTQVLSKDELRDNGLLEQNTPAEGWRNPLLGNPLVGNAIDDDAVEAMPQDEAVQVADFANTADEPESSPDDSLFAAAPAAPAQPSAGGSGDDEESIEAYMSRLLQRVRGDSAGEAPKFVMPSSTPVEEPVAAQPATPAPAATPAVAAEPVDPESFMPRSHAPEVNSDLAAMRELANSAAKSAITTHAKRRQGQRIANRLVYSSMALFTTVGMAAWAMYFDGGHWAWAGAATGALLISFWTFQSIASAFKMMQLKRQLPAGTANEQADVEEETND